MRADQLETQNSAAESTEIQTGSYKCIPVPDDVALIICNLTVAERENYTVVSDGDNTHLVGRIAGQGGLETVAIDEEVFRRSLESAEVNAREWLHRESFPTKATNNANNNATKLTDDELRALGFDLPEVRVSKNPAGFFPASNSQVSATNSAAVAASSPAAAMK